MFYEVVFRRKKNILLQAVGVNENLNISFCKVDISDGVLLLCTDGLYNSLSDEEILNIVENNDGLNDMGEENVKVMHILELLEKAYE